MSGAGCPVWASSRTLPLLYLLITSTVQAASGLAFPFFTFPRACVVITMEEYENLDPYSRSRYEHGIDSKIVIMGNSGILFIPSAIPLLAAYFLYNRGRKD